MAEAAKHYAEFRGADSQKSKTDATGWSNGQLLMAVGVTSVCVALLAIVGLLVCGSPFNHGGADAEGAASAEEVLWLVLF